MQLQNTQRISGFHLSGGGVGGGERGQLPPLDILCPPPPPEVIGVNQEMIYLFMIN